MTESQQTEEIKRYLFSEMSDEESDAHEERYYADAEYFNELVGLETDLIDRYAIGKLNGKDLQRFEQSLEKSPERRKKIADARIFQNLIAEEKANRKTIVIAAPTFWEKLSEYFKISTSGLKLAAGTLAILLICTASFLVYRNTIMQKDFADNERQQRQEQELDEQKKRQQQESEEQKRIDEQRRQDELNNRQSENSNINAQPNTEQRQIENEQRQKDIEKRQKQIDELEKRRDIKPSIRQNEQPANETIAVEISPVGAGEIKLTQGKTDNVNTEFIAQLPKNNDYDKIEIKLNGVTIKTIDIAFAQKTAVFDLTVNQINDAEIEIKPISDTRSGSVSVSKFKLKLKKKKK